MQHTPTPWTVDRNGTIRASSTGPLSNPVHAATIANNNDELMEADAQFIVRACNAHDELITQLRDSQERIEATLPILKGDYPVLCAALLAQFKDNRAILAKAEGR